MWGNLDYESTAPINAVLAVQEDSSLYPYEEEPVTLQEVKDYAKIDFDDDDALLTSLISVARMTLETYTGLSFVPKRLTCQLQNDCGNIEIPYGPMYGDLDTTLITDSTGEVVAIDTYGLDFLSIKTKTNFVQIIYSAGYVDLPYPLQTAIKAQVFFLYENRGERLSFSSAGVRVYDVDYVCQAAQQLADRFRRVWDAIF